MTGPVPSPDPADTPVEVDAETETDAEADADAETEAAPLNRADRRARKRGQSPGHVGPQSDGYDRRGKGPRSHTKRV